MDSIQTAFSTISGMFNAILTIVNIGLALYCFFSVFSVEDTDNLKSTAKKANWILILCLFMIFALSLDIFRNYYIASTAIASAPTTDPRIISYGVSVLISRLANIFIISFFIMIWLMLRIIIRNKAEPIE